MRTDASTDALASDRRFFRLPAFRRRRDAKQDEEASDDKEKQEEAKENKSEEANSSASDATDEATDAESSTTDKPIDGPSSPQPTNQTRPAIVFVPPPLHPHRPSHPYYLPSPHPNRKNKRPSLLSSLLSAIVPSPQPNHPYGPPRNDFSITILGLFLRLTLLTLTTHLLDAMGLGSGDSASIPPPAQHYTFERVNDRYRRDGKALQLALNSPPLGVGKYAWKRILNKRRRDTVASLAELECTTTSSVANLQTGKLYNKTLIIVEIKPDARVGNGMAEYLRDAVSFLIEQHRDHSDRRRNVDTPTRSSRGIRTALGTDLEILLLLDSPGGTVQDYGLASSQLARLRDEPRVTLSVCVDRIAASGGYMMACMATPGNLFAAPFAVVGSIGVLMETVNFNDVLNKYGVKPLTIKAGKRKASLKTLGEVTEEEIEMAQSDADGIHAAFQRHVLSSRPNVPQTSEWVEKVCTGSVFLGREALELGLIDRVCTSDEDVAERIRAGDRVLRLMSYRGPQFGLRLSPLDLLLGDAEGRMKLREVVGKVRGVVGSIARVGGAVGVLNVVHHLATLNCGSDVCLR